MTNDCDAVLIGICCCHGVALYIRGNPVVGAVGETASMKRRKLWKTGEDGLCCSSSAIQTRLDPSSLLEERSETPICLFFVVSFVLSATPQTGGNGQGISIDNRPQVMGKHTKEFSNRKHASQSQ